MELIGFCRKYEITTAETEQFTLRRNEKLQTVQAGTRSVRRTVQRDLLKNNGSSEAKRAQHQEELHREMMKNAKKKLTQKKEKGDGDADKKETSAREFVSYKSSKDFPAEAQPEVVCFLDQLNFF